MVKCVQGVENVRLDLIGRVNNITLGSTRVFMPLFEAVVNSLQAIEDLKDSKTRSINIYVRRENSNPMLNLADEGSLELITGFVVEDNGIGFTSENYAAFNTSDTTTKYEKGGKGVGRFLWLKAFDLVKVESHFKENGETWIRSFDFTLSHEDGIINHRCIKATTNEPNTRVSLIDLKPKYQKECQRKLDVIAGKIIEHCLSYLLNENCPQISIQDDDEFININQMFMELIKTSSETDSFITGDYVFKLIHLKKRSGDDSRHRIHFCANGREVLSETLNNAIPGLNRRLKDASNSFVYTGYLSGSFLDESVNQERTDFIFPDEEDKLEYPGLLTKSELWQKAIKRVEHYLNPYIEPALQDNLKRVKKYIQEEKPEYRFLLAHREKQLKTVGIGLPNEKLEVELFKQTQEFDLELKKKSIDFLNDKKSGNDDNDKYEQEFNQYLEQINDLGKANLAKYILHRKLILDLLEKRLMVGNDENYRKEDSIHKLFFPMRKDSNEIGYEEQNLWIIDERLAYHYYLASDTPLVKTMEKVDGSMCPTLKRPDIIIFNNPLLFVGEEQPYSSIVILEFKRPGKKHYSGGDNPIEQVFKYIRTIRSLKQTDKTGRPITFHSNIPFYAYVICDISDNIMEYADAASLLKTNDGMGYYGYNPNYQAYIEVISYDKLLIDAKKRNKVLFDKLFSGFSR